MPHPAPTLDVERELLATYGPRLAAVDEVGRGALAGPVTVGVAVVGACTDDPPPGLADSKLLTPVERDGLAGPVARWVVESAVGHASAAEVDSCGLTGALRVAAWRAFSLLGSVDVVLLDGSHDWLRAPAQQPLFTQAGPELADALSGVWLSCPVVTRVKADLSCASVAAASVLAKVARDEIMRTFDTEFPAYGFAQHKGYASSEHVAALASVGPCRIHRSSWRLPGVVSR